MRNGSANIMRKVATQLGLNLAEVGRASLTVPQRIDLFKILDRSYRKRCVRGASRREVRLIAAVATSV